MNPAPFFRSLVFSGLALLFTIGFSNCAGDHTETKANQAYLAEINGWHEGRIKRLTSRTGWLSLSGLYWLKEGANSFGSDPDNRIKFPVDGTPSHIGTFLLENGEVTAKINAGVKVYCQDSLVSEIKMIPDISGDPTVLRLDSLSWFIIRRGAQTGVRLRNSINPRLKAFEGIERFPVDSTWRVAARLEPYHPPKLIDVPTVLGTVDTSASPGALVFSIAGDTYRLDPLGEPGDKRLFIIFADLTNSHETYGAGRFLYIDAPDATGRTMIDFNRAYNPPCAFTPYATCPLPPPQNVLPLAVTAGEKKYGDH